MNKYCFVLFFFLFVFGGCNPNNHNFNEFMGIPIEGDVDEFGKKLSTRGYDFVIDETVIPALVFHGNYLNKEVSVQLHYESETRKIESVRVLFIGKVTNLASLVKEFTDKYGQCEMEVMGSLIIYNWKVNDGKINIMTSDSRVGCIGYYNYWK